MRDGACIMDETQYIISREHEVSKYAMSHGCNGKKVISIGYVHNGGNTTLPSHAKLSNRYRRQKYNAFLLMYHQKCTKTLKKKKKRIII